MSDKISPFCRPKCTTLNNFESTDSVPKNPLDICKEILCRFPRYKHPLVPNPHINLYCTFVEK